MTPKPGFKTLDHAVLDSLVPEGTAHEILVSETLDYADELAGPEPSPTERLLADVASVCWLALRRDELGARQATDDTVAVAEYRQRQIGRHHRRLCVTLRTLAQVRRLAGPRYQINLANQQVVNN